MRIDRVELIPIALPFRETYRTASGELRARSMLVVRIHDSDGRIGLGEAVPLSLRGGPSLGVVAAELARCGEALAGADADTAASSEPVEVNAWIRALLGTCAGVGAGAQATAALDMALHDLAGRAGGLPVWRLLGAPDVQPVTCNATLDAGEPRSVAARAAEQHRAGFTTHKIKVGSGADAERVAAVRRAVGEQAFLRIDANGAWDPEHALRFLEELAPIGIELAEQPCADLTGLAIVRARTGTPIVADESVATLDDGRAAVEARACDAATIKLAKVGGPLQALRLASTLPCYLSSALDGPIGIAAAVHTAQAMPRGGEVDRYAHGLATLDMYESLYAPGDGLFGPSLTPPRSPGLGVEVDGSALEELRIA